MKMARKGHSVKLMLEITAKLANSGDSQSAGYGVGIWPAHNHFHSALTSTRLAAEFRFQG
jgi:hypothetical protein